MIILLVARIVRSSETYNLCQFLYRLHDKFSLAGLFQRMDNFLANGLDDNIKAQREKAAQEKAELQTVNLALGKDFPQKEEVELARENHAAVIRELQRMQDDVSYVSQWTPKTSKGEDSPKTDALAVKCQHVVPAPGSREAGGFLSRAVCGRWKLYRYVHMGKS